MTYSAKKFFRFVFLAIVLLAIVLLVAGCETKKPITVPPAPLKVEEKLKVKEKIEENIKQDIVAEAEGIKKMTPHVNVPGVPAAIDDSANLIIKKAGGNTTAEKTETVNERVLAAIGKDHDKYKELYENSVKQTDKIITELKNSNADLIESVAEMKAHYASQLEAIRIENEKQEKIRKDAENDRARTATTQICGTIATILGFLGILSIIACLKIPSVPKYSPLIFFGAAAMVMAYAILASQAWFPYVLAVFLVLCLIEGYKHVKHVLDHVTTTNKYSQAMKEFVIGVEKYKKEEKITEEQFKDLEVFSYVSKSMSPESKLIVNDIKTDLRINKQI